MDWADWAPTMAAIRAEFGYAETDDRAAALALRDLLPGAHWRELGMQLRNRRHVVVAGCGPGLGATTAADFAGNITIAADGATTRLRELGIVPQVIITDLDGRAEDLRWAAGEGARLVVHAHGDNRPELASIVPALGPLVHGTHQVEPAADLASLRNYGGFTDGDRAVLLCEELAVREVRLLGFDFDAAPSPYSNRWDPATKPAKLAWARRIVDGVQARGRTLVRYAPAQRR